MTEEGRCCAEGGNLGVSKEMSLTSSAHSSSVWFACPGLMQIWRLLNNPLNDIAQKILD